MDWSHFRMTRRPFRPAVDTGSYFPASTHESAQAAVTAAFARRDPIVLIDGPPGTGKSLVARLWLERLPRDVPKFVPPTTEAAHSTDLLQAILFDLNQPYRGLSEQELRLAVTDRILAGAAAGHPTVMVIDEAQHLGPAALEDLRLLGNIETPDGSALLLVLVAQPSFREMLTRPGVEAFSQRLGVRCRIEPFTADESAAYLRHQVRIAGGEPAEVLDDEAVAVIAGACGGVARVLNQAASLAAELAVGVGAEMIDVEAALEAIHALGLSSSTAEGAEDLVTLPHPGQAARPIEEQPSTGREAAIRDDPRAVRGPKQKTGRKRSA